MQGDYFILCTKASCQHFSPPRRNFFHHKSYSFLSRTGRLTNSNPKALLLGCRGTLAQNRGTMGVQIPFSFPKSLDFKPLQTKVRILPWQMKSIFIIVLFLLDSPRNALFCEGFRGFVKYVFLLASWQNRARWSKLVRAVSSKVGSKLERLTTKFFITLLLKIDLPLFNPFR